MQGQGVEGRHDDADRPTGLRVYHDFWRVTQQPRTTPVADLSCRVLHPGDPNRTFATPTPPCTLCPS